MAQTGRTVIIEIQAKAQSAVRAIQELEKESENVKEAAQQVGRSLTEAGDQAEKAFSKAIGEAGSARQAIVKTKQAFDQLGAGAQKSSTRITAGTDKAIRSMKGLERAIRHTFSELIKNTGRGVQSVNSMTAAFRDLERRQKITARQLETGVIAGMNRVDSSALTMRSSLSASANNLGFEMVQAAQDAKFGLAGVANQIPLMTEQLTQLTLKSGSTAGALTALKKAFIGPVGIVAAITLFLTYQDDLIGFFTETGGAAKDAEDRFQGFFDELNNGVKNLELLQEEMERATNEIGTFKAGLNITAEAADFVTGATKIASALSIVASAVGGAFAGLAVFEGLSDRIEIEKLESLVRNLRRALEEGGPAADFLRSQLVEMGVDMEALTEGSIAEAVLAIREFQEQIRQLGEDTEGALRERPQAFIENLKSRLQEIREEADFQVRFEFITEEDALERQIEFLEDALTRARELTETPEEYKERFGPLLETLRELKSRLGGLEEETDDVSSALDELIEKRDELKRLVAEETGDTRRQLGAIRNEIAELENRREVEKEISDLLAERPGLREDEARQIIFLRRVIEDLKQIEEEPAGRERARRERDDPRAEIRAAQRFSERLSRVRAQLSGLQAEIEAGITTPFQAARAEVSLLTRGLQFMLENGVDPNSEEFENWVEDLDEARKNLAEMTLLFRSVNEFAEGAAEAITSAIFGDPEQLRQLRDERQKIIEQLERARADATVTDPNIANIRRLREELAEANGRLREMTTLAGRVAEAFKEMGNVVLQILKRVVAELTAAVIKAAILRAIAAAFGIGGDSSFGELFTAALIGREEGGIVAEQMQSGGFVSGPGGPTSDSIAALLSDGEFVVNAQSTAVAPELLRRINDNPGFAKALNQSFVTNNSFADGGFVGGSPGSLSRATSTKADVRLEVVPGVLPSGDLSFGVRRAESTRERLGYTTT